MAPGGDPRWPFGTSRGSGPRIIWVRHLNRLAKGRWIRPMRLDHVVLWTKDPRVSMDFYVRVVGLAPVRFAEFETGDAPFPSVRVCEDSIIDLLPVANAGGHRIVDPGGRQRRSPGQPCLPGPVEVRIRRAGPAPASRRRGHQRAVAPELRRPGVGAAGLLLRRSRRQCGGGAVLRMMKLAAPGPAWGTARRCLCRAATGLARLGRAGNRRER